MKLVIDHRIFDTFKSVKLGVVFGFNIDNTKGQKEISELLSHLQEKQKSEFSGVDLANHERIVPWRQAYSKFGSKPSKYNSSIESLLKRVVSGGNLSDINPLVNLYNAMSLKHVLPFGAEDLDKVKGDIRLAFAEGNEAGKYIGSDLVDTCDKGEVAYLDDLGFICRRWNWREADRTKITEETNNFILITEGLENVSEGDLQKAIENFVSVAKEYLGGEYKTFLLNEKNPLLRIDFETGKELTEKDLIMLMPAKSEKKQSRKELKKESRVYIGIAKEIVEALKRVTGLDEINLEIPENQEFGDYSTNVAMQLFAKTPNIQTPKTPSKSLINRLTDIKSPRELSEKIVEELKSDKELEKVVDKIEVAGPGFINFYLTRSVLVSILRNVIEKKDDFGKSDLLRNKKYLIEHTSPNTIKTLHVGHVRNNVLGMSVHNILEFAGAEVALDAINNDRGIHVMKAVWAYMKYGNNKTPESEKVKPDHFVDKFYVMGAKEADENPDSKEEMQELLIRWESGDKEVRSVWKKLRDWTFNGFKETYSRFGSHHDQQWFESDFYEHGKEMVAEGLKKGIFKKLEDGAVLSNLEKYGLTDTIVLRADGTSMYHTQDLYLTKLKREKFQSDLYIWDIGPEQELYLKQLFAMCEQLGIGKREDYMHLSYGFVYLQGGGKMSSRAGNVVSADDLINESVSKAQVIIENSETRKGLKDKEKRDIAEVVGMAAIKYGFMKVARTTDIHFDTDKSLSLEGNSGPYLQYTYARTQSVLHKFKVQSSKLKTISKNSQAKKLSDLTFEFNEEELSLLRSFVHFPEVIESAAKTYSPNLLCNYLYDLAQKFNLFYQKHRILPTASTPEVKAAPISGVNESEEIITFRLSLTSATGQILKSGLNLLGIKAPEKM